MMIPTVQIIEGDALTRLRELPEKSVHCCVTSPPYWGLRDYKHAGQIGQEKTPELYVAALVAVFKEVNRVMRDDGTLWLNLGDSYATGAGSARSPGGKCFGKQNTVIANGDFPKSQPNRMPLPDLKPKDLVGIPWMVAFALRSDGWYLRSDIIWHKPNPMPESVTDRPTKSHEYIFLLSKSERYYYDAHEISEPSVYPFDNRGSRNDSRRGTECNRVSGNSGATRNKRSVWTIATNPYPEAHFATFPSDLIKPCILAGCPVGGTVIDPFGGSGTTGEVSLELGRSAILIELNPEYVELAKTRTFVTPGLQLA